MKCAALACFALLFAAPAAAQNLALEAPAWAQALVATDVTPTTGGRAELPAAGITSSVRVTIAPTRGGVARVIRYDVRGTSATLALRRFTGHASTGWWLWGSDAPTMINLSNAQREEVAGLMRALGNTSGAVSTNTGGACNERAFVEIATSTPARSVTRECVSNTDAVGRLALKLSEIAGSRTEEELAAAAVREVMDADRAFAALAASEGVPAAFARYTASDGMIVTSQSISNGREGVTALFQDWPAGMRLEWAPETARVSARGDMAWSWGNSVRTAADGTRTPGRYISVWTRDYEGNWRYAFDAAIR